MSKLELLESSFISKFKQFIQSLNKSNAIPFITQYYDVIMVGIDFNEKQILKTFISDILQYEDQIKNKDENFFLKYDFNSKYKNLNSGITQNISKSDVNIDFIFQFKNNWQQLSENNKNAIFNHMILLCKIAHAYKVEWDKL